MKEQETHSTDDKSLLEALAFTDHGEEMTDEELKALAEDESFADAFDEVMRLKSVVQHKGASAPDTDAEWRTFAAKMQRKESPAPVAASSVVRHRTHRRRVWLWTAVSAAAVVLLFFSLNHWLKPAQQLRPGEVVFTAEKQEPTVTLEDADGNAIALDNPQALAQVGTVVKGDSMHVTAYATETPQNLKISIPRTKTFRLVLSDGSEVLLNTDSKLYYPSHFTGAERRVVLEGEAYFRVKHDSQHPFIVETEGVETRVLGTEFNVKAYKGSSTHVTLVNGKVAVSSRRSSAKDVLSPGQDACLTENGDFVKKNVDPDKYKYWSEGLFYFDDEPLSDIAQDLGRWYNLNVVFQDEGLMDVRLHFMSYRDEGVDSAVKLLNTMGSFQVWREGNTLYFK
jgi:transmembrane sensor